MHQNVLTSYDWLEATVTKEPDMNLLDVVSMYGFKIHRPAANHIRPLVIWKIATRRAAEQTSLLGEAEGLSRVSLRPFGRANEDSTPGTT